MQSKIAELSDIDFLAPRLRAADMVEVAASEMGSPHEALCQAWMESDHSWTIWHVNEAGEEEPLAIYGISPNPHVGKGSGAVAWMMGTDAITEHYMAFARFTRSIVRGLCETHGFLYNFVHPANRLHIRWLTWLGASWPGTRRINGVPFQYFVLKDIR